MALPSEGERKQADMCHDGEAQGEQEILGVEISGLPMSFWVLRHRLSGSDVEVQMATGESRASLNMLRSDNA
jgi:hypothetical protein